MEAAACGVRNLDPCPDHDLNGRELDAAYNMLALRVRETVETDSPAAQGQGPVDDHFPKNGNIANPVGFLIFAVKQLPLLVWALGVGAILAIIAIVYFWKVPPTALVLGGVGLFFGMFGLWVFAGLVRPTPENIKPPLVSKVTVWATAAILMGCGFLVASSFFFDWPIPLRSHLFPYSGHA